MAYKALSFLCLSTDPSNSLNRTCVAVCLIKHVNKASCSSSLDTWRLPHLPSVLVFADT